MDECLAYRQTQRSSLQLGLRVVAHVVPAHVHSSDPSECAQRLFHIIDDSTTNIMLVIIIIIVVAKNQFCVLAVSQCVFSVFEVNCIEFCCTWQHAGDCICHEGYCGSRCDDCAVGYTGYPHCEPCPCSAIGSINDDICVKCVCKVSHCHSLLTTDDTWQYVNKMNFDSQVLLFEAAVFLCTSAKTVSSAVVLYGNR